jgi:cell division protein FtsL
MKEEQRIHLRHYLLGELNEQEREALAEKYFIDEELFDELLEVENELFDQYARNKLSQTEKEQFASYIQSLPDGKFKLAAAQALSSASASEKTSSPVSEVKAVESVSLWQSVQDLFFGRQFVFQYALASALLIALVAVAYLYIHQRQLQKENEQLRARVSQSEKDRENLNQQAKDAQQEQNEKIRQLEEELAQVKPQKEKTVDEKEKPQGKEPTIISTIATLILTPALRSGSKPDVLRLKPENKTVSLTIPINTHEQIANYRAVLQLSDGGEIVLTRENLKPAGSSRNRRVSISIPAKQLTGKSYKLTLQGRAADGIEIAQEYYFEITKN